MSVPAHERPELALDQNNNLFLRTFELPKGFEQCGCIGEDPNKDADHRNKGEERQQQGTKAVSYVAFIKVIQGKRPAKSQEGELDECLLFKSLHGWMFGISTYIAMVSPKTFVPFMS